MLTKQHINCSTCGNETDNGLNILKDIFICKDCIYKILTLYIHLNPIKLFCPFCQINKNNKCHYCDIGLKMGIFKYENI